MTQYTDQYTHEEVNAYREANNASERQQQRSLLLLCLTKAAVWAVHIQILRHRRGLKICHDWTRIHQHGCVCPNHAELVHPRKYGSIFSQLCSTNACSHGQRNRPIPLDEHHNGSSYHHDNKLEHFKILINQDGSIPPVRKGSSHMQRTRMLVVRQAPNLFVHMFCGIQM